MRRKTALRLDDLKLFHFITSEGGEVYLDDRTTADIADSLLFNCLPDAMVIGSSAAGRGASGELADEVRERRSVRLRRRGSRQGHLSWWERATLVPRPFRRVYSVPAI
ncbi:hypothetical protein [Collinsella aerofaciens]|uniref:hypothetical protein n=2 Tax=Collinsella TaxID=102106 RepID=UPI0034A234B8